MVLLYSEGEHDTRYVLDQDRLTLEIDDSMTVVMNRVQ
ncbi:WD40 repeat protein [Vibrio cholerae]|uniref:WD40 repeat protein n=1 Tax=Vibrio cholerae TaxID=666 RepID=A0A655QZG0_VIBCL|nr:WD40 repeat protein [Vibrio cholerae]CSB42451.1 WD40 repeat protein [Vibrio cholerae]